MLRSIVKAGSIDLDWNAKDRKIRACLTSDKPCSTIWRTNINISIDYRIALNKYNTILLDIYICLTGWTTQSIRTYFIRSSWSLLKDL